MLRFRTGPGALTFHVAETPAISTPLPPESLTASSVAAPAIEQRPPRPPWPPRLRRTAERYHDVLPRWMREGQQADRPHGRAKCRSR